MPEGYQCHRKQKTVRGRSRSWAECQHDRQNDENLTSASARKKWNIGEHRRLQCPEVRSCASRPGCQHGGKPRWVRATLLKAGATGHSACASRRASPCPDREREEGAENHRQGGKRRWLAVARCDGLR